MSERQFQTTYTVHRTTSVHLSFLQSRLYLRLLLLQLFAALLQLVDALSSLTKLLSQVRNLLYLKKESNKALNYF